MNSEIVFAAGEGPGAPFRPSTSEQSLKMDRKPTKVGVSYHHSIKVRFQVSRAKQWSEEVEEIFRFQEAGYRDEYEYNAFNPDQQVVY